MIAALFEKDGTLVGLKEVAVSVNEVHHRITEEVTNKVYSTQTFKKTDDYSKISGFVSFNDKPVVAFVEQ